MAHTTTNSTDNCPDDRDLLAFHLASLEERRMDEVQLHVEGCDQCILFLDSQEKSDTVIQALDTISATTDDESEFRDLQAALLAAPENIKTALWVPELTDIESAFWKNPLDRIGESIGEYELIELLGCGGNGAVYKAIHRKLERFFALKVLAPQGRNVGDSLFRFQQEMKAVGKLDHPNIVKATDAGEFQGCHYLVMEFVDGIDFSWLVRKLGPLSPANAAQLIAKIALGLHCAHEQGMVHRDVKPSNLFFEYSGEVKLLDLGLVSFAEATIGNRSNVEGSTQHDSRKNDAVKNCSDTTGSNGTGRCELVTEGLARGTADYMAPEQWDDFREVDARADIYSLGCTMFKLLCGHAPFAELPVGFDSKRLAHRDAPFPSIKSINPDVPLGLDRMIRRMTAKDKGKRYGSMFEVAEALAPYAADADLASITARLLGNTGDDHLSDASQVAKTKLAAKHFTRRNVLIATATGLLGALSYRQIWSSKKRRRSAQDWRSLYLGKRQRLVSIDPAAAFEAIPRERSGPRTATLSAKVDPNADKVIKLKTKDSSMLPLGQPVHGKFMIETQIAELQPQGRAGLAFRYHRTQPKIGMLHEFQTIEISSNDSGRLRVAWRNFQWRMSRVEPEFDEQVWGEFTTAQRVTDKPITINVALGVHPLPQVTINDAAISDDQWTLQRFGEDAKQITHDRLQREYLGHIGLFAHGHAVNYLNTRLKYLI